jgi:PAS domain S-box-containing protein
MLEKKEEIGILFMGEITQDIEVLSALQEIYKNNFCATDKVSILNIIKKYSPKVIVTTYSYEYLEYHDIALSIKAHNPEIKIIMLIYETDCSKMKKILSMECCSYVYFSSSSEKNIERILNALEEARQSINSEKNEKYYNALLEDSIVSKSDPKGNITYINDNFTKVTGYTKAECYGKNHNILRHPANSVKVYEYMWETITQGKIWRERVLNKNKDGSNFWAETTIIPYKDKKTDKIVEYVAIRRDITEMIELRRRAMRQEIEAKEQKQITEAKDSFLILFTHELKTPLNAIINFSKYFLKHIVQGTFETLPLAKKRHLVEEIINSATLMLSDVTNILDISRIRSHKLNYTYIPFSVKNALKDVIQSHTSLAQEQKVEVFFEDDGSEPFLTSDRQRVQQIFANIISNAIKYSHGKVYISLSYEVEKVKLVVEDNGDGIEDKKVIFELFEQSGKGFMKKEKKGTGIGLNFVKLLCRDLGFKYQLETSQKLGGLKFILEKQLKGM